MRGHCNCLAGIMVAKMGGMAERERERWVDLGYIWKEAGTSTGPPDRLEVGVGG